MIIILHDRANGKKHFIIILIHFDEKFKQNL